MRRILLLGKTGQVGFELERVLRPLHQLYAPGRTELDLTDPDSIRRTIQDNRPEIIVNAAGFTIVDDAEAQPAAATQLNATMPGLIAEQAAGIGAVLLHYSTVFVFDGTKRTPYTEDDMPNPVNIYGRSKLAGELAVTASGAKHIILRANWVYSARRNNFALAMLRIARERKQVGVVTDQIGSPTWARDYAAATAELINDFNRLRDQSGIYNLSAQSHCSRMAWARKLIDCAKPAFPPDTDWAALHAIATEQYALSAPRPLYVVTDNRKIAEAFGIHMPLWEDRVEAFTRTLAEKK